MCIINEEADAYLAYGMRSGRPQSDTSIRSRKLLGAFAGCFLNGSLVTATLYKNDERSQPGRLQEPIEGPCNKWAVENSSKERLEAQHNKEPTTGNDHKEDGKNRIHPPHYRTAPEVSEQARRHHVNAQYSHQIANTGVNKHNYFKASPPAIPRFHQVLPNKTPSAQIYAPQAYHLPYTSAYIHGPTIPAPSPHFITTQAVYNRQFSLSAEHFQPYPQSTQPSTFTCLQPWSSHSAQTTSTLTTTPTSISNSPYLTSPSSAGSISSHAHSIQLTPVRFHPFVSSRLPERS